MSSLLKLYRYFSNVLSSLFKLGCRFSTYIVANKSISSMFKREEDTENTGRLMARTNAGEESKGARVLGGMQLKNKRSVIHAEEKRGCAATTST